MARPLRLLPAAALVAGLVALVPATPASAAVTVTSAGTVVTVTLTGNGFTTFSCTGGQFHASGVAATPTIACGSVTRVNVNGDGGNQTVSTSELLGAAFAANPYLVASLGAGNDQISETDRADTLDLGADDDIVFLRAGGIDNTAVTLGAGGNDTAYFDGTDQRDTVSLGSVNANASATVTNGEGGSTRLVQNTDRVVLRAGIGNDTLVATGVTAASAIGSITLMGGPGNDTMVAGVKSTFFYGDEGTNTFHGGAGHDQYRSESDTDVIDSGTAGDDIVYDLDNGRSGGRTISGTGATQYAQYQYGCDLQARVRPGASATAQVIASLCRPGLQQVPASIGLIDVFANDAKQDRALMDVVIPGQDVTIRGDAQNDDLADITVPSGTWNSTGSSPGTVIITPTSGAYGQVNLQNYGAVSVHGPWTDKADGFAHRVTRDLLFRFATAAQRQAIVAQQTAGTSRPAIATGLMATDEYRGLDVDRVFVRFLHRPADPGGRTYWINALRNGRSLQKFRAQLFGSNEYYANSFNDDETFVEDAYFDVLNRVPDAAGKAYWVNKIATGTDRGSVANAFLASTEARRAIVKDQFLRFAQRFPTATEADTWVATLASATGEQELIAFLAGSNAYYQAS